MKSSNLSSLKLFQFPAYLFIVLFVLSFASCEKEESSEIKYGLQFSDISYFPGKDIALTFTVVPNVDRSPFSIKWYEPSALTGLGPFTMNISSDLSLDFELTDAGNKTERFTYKVLADTIDSLKYDYRNRYIGQYNCDVTYSYQGEYQYFKDTLTVTKSEEFGVLRINNAGMIYNEPGSFYAYHAGASFRNDSIFYSTSGPLGAYYTYTYIGAKMK
ncbi:MAG: hypothetical protein IPH88_02950 [Bacteroidales bacterium]|nr:hypothetical protein [Bacteroidales bacterium]